MLEEIKLKVPEEDYKHNTDRQIFKCLNCGAEIPKFVWGKASENTCEECGLRQPCCE